MPDLNRLSLPELYAHLTRGGAVVERLVEAAIDEDLDRAGDITSASIIPQSKNAAATVTARRPGVIAGLPAIEQICSMQDLQCELLAADGQACAPAQELARIEGNLRQMLGVERIILNLLGRLSGIATLTRHYVDAIQGTKAAICDTRKTTPGLRHLEKYAVRCGGGTLHRIGLFDAALYKDNHLAGIALNQLAQRVSGAARSVRASHDVRFVEVEVDTLDQLQEILAIEPGVIDVVLLDNMLPLELDQAVAARNRTRPEIVLEASGGVTLENVREVAKTGVDRIAVGAITHAAAFLDVALDMQR